MGNLWYKLSTTWSYFDDRRTELFSNTILWTKIYIHTWLESIRYFTINGADYQLARNLSLRFPTWDHQTPQYSVFDVESLRLVSTLQLGRKNQSTIKSWDKYDINYYPSANWLQDLLKVKIGFNITVSTDK